MNYLIDEDSGVNCNSPKHDESKCSKCSEENKKDMQIMEINSYRSKHGKRKRVKVKNKELVFSTDKF